MPVEQLTSSIEAAANWRNNKKQAVPEIASILQESRKVVDAYLFVSDKDGDLYSNTAKQKVSEAVKRSNEIGRLEGLAVDRINDWYKKSKQGAVAWVSPMDPTYYSEDSKIIFSEIVYVDGKKGLFNRAIILDRNAEEACDIAKALSERSQNRPLLESVNTVRSTPIFLDGANWMDIGSEVIDEAEIWKKVRSGEDIKEQELTFRLWV